MTILAIAAHNDDHIIFHLKVAEADMGRVIGKQGRIANAMRTLLKVAAIRRGEKAILEIGPQQILVVRDGKREHLLPMLDSVIEAVDLKARRIRVKPPPGLLELNA